MPNEVAEDGGWEVIKRRRPRGRGKTPQVPKAPERKAGEGRKDERSREEVLRAFERDCERWGREWEGLGCREGLEGVMGRVRRDLGIKNLSTEEGDRREGEGVKGDENEGKGAPREPGEEGVKGATSYQGTTKGQSCEKTNGSQHGPGPGYDEGKMAPEVPSREPEGNTAESTPPPETTKDKTEDGPEGKGHKLPQSNGSSGADSKVRWPRRKSGLSRAVCLGIGSFEDEGWEVVRRTWVQYFAFLGVVRGLDPGLPIIFQEPDFTPGDKAFLESRGHIVADDPGGFEAVAEDPGGTLVVGFHLYIPVYRRVLDFGSGDLPRVFVGTGWDVWDDINKGDEIPSLRRMHETYRSEAFPQDHVIATFSSTNIYWLPAGEARGKALSNGEGGFEGANGFRGVKDSERAAGSRGKAVSGGGGGSKGAEPGDDKESQGA